MGTGQADGRALVLAHSREVAAALRATPAGRRLQVAELRFRADPDIPKILHKLQEHGQAFRRAQETGTLTQEQIRPLREAQAQYREHPAAQELELARTGMAALLREVNAVMGNILGLDIGRIVGPAGGGCCG